jgi:hypothetical protein
LPLHSYSMRSTMQEPPKHNTRRATLPRNWTQHHPRSWCRGPNYSHSVSRTWWFSCAM